MAATQARCANCTARETCLPAGLAPSELERFETLVAQRQGIRRGDRAFGAGDPFASLVAVHSGSFRTSAPYEGREQVTGFPMAGSLLGLDAIGTGQQRCTAVAMEDSEVCLLPFDALERAARKWQWLQRALHRALSREIVRQHGLIVRLSALQSQRRVAAFIRDLGRLRARSTPSRTLVLRMSRAEIGSYLGLKLETVSRALTQLHQLGVLEVRQRRVRIVDDKALAALCGSSA